MGSSASRRPRARLSKGMYILPSLFTTGNMAAGFYAILEIVHREVPFRGGTDIAHCVLGGQAAAERRVIEDTLAGLRFVRNQMGGAVDQADFVSPGAGNPDLAEGGITAWTCRPYDGYQQRFRQGAGFSGRRDHVRRCPGHARLDLGISSDAPGIAYGLEYQAHPIRSNRELPVSNGRSQPPGAFQHHNESAAFEPRASG